MNDAPTPSTLHLAQRSLRYAGLSALVLGLGLAATAFMVQRTPQVYRSEAVLLYRQAARQGNSDDSARRAGARLSDMTLARERLRRLTDEFKLYPEIADRNAAVDDMRRKVAFKARDGSTFLITFDSSSPAQAQAVNGRLVQTLIEDNTRQRAKETEEMRRVLEAERGRLEEDLRARQAAVTQYLGLHPEAAMARETGGSENPDVDALAREVERVRGVRPSSGDPVARTVDAELLAAERKTATDLAQARRELAEKQQRLTDVHPDVVVANERVRQAESSWRELRDAVTEANAMPAPIRPAATSSSSSNDRALSSVEQQLARIKRSARSGGRQISSRALRGEVELQSLRHELDQARERLAGLEEKQVEAQLQAKMDTNAETGQLAILDPASRPGLPVVDVRKKVLLGGVAASLMLAIGLALLRARTDDRIHDQRDAQWLGGQPVLASIPERRRRRAHG